MVKQRFSISLDNEHVVLRSGNVFRDMDEQIAAIDSSRWPDDEAPAELTPDAQVAAVWDAFFLVPKQDET
ncbi:hypothetical protein [Kitasatospora sp. MAP5-34]|uniref:hypothetical protein n=1 Tax=Kitasatospora sp. MAP5-34 TaxID=3035102 RepID=UPI002476D467|nr:hypothetical protein [Kitasatospora sp. MAP5-34]MDH6577652.1 hypothetical protein [Kitasatospora sp. MAP5-34]